MTRLLAVIDSGDELGEGVLWRASDQSAWWTDILGHRLHCLTWPSCERVTWTLPERLASFAFIEGNDDWLLAAFAPGFALFNPATGEHRWLDRPAELGADLRLNDGRVDARGRFWVGSMGEPPGRGPSRGSLYCLEAGQPARVVRSGVGIANGLCWSPDGRFIYFADSLAGVVERAPFDVETGTAGSFSSFASIRDLAPDGAVTDAQGNYWCAVWGGARVDGFNAQGQLIASIPIPAPQPTCPAFGGPDHSLLFVTSARTDLDADTLAAHPQSGSLFVFETSGQGTAAARASNAFLAAKT
jgi:sugar lactone lactonase YvrE